MCSCLLLTVSETGLCICLSLLKEEEENTIFLISHMGKLSPWEDKKLIEDQTTGRWSRYIPYISQSMSLNHTDQQTKIWKDFLVSVSISFHSNVLSFISTYSCPFLQEGDMIDSSLHWQCLAPCLCHGKAKVKSGPGRKGWRMKGRSEHIPEYGSHSCFSVFSSVQSLSHVWLFVTPWIAAHQASLSLTNSRSPPKPMSIELVMPSNHLTLCHPLLLLPSIFLIIQLFPVSQLFASGGQSIGVSASASVLPMNTQDWSPLGWTGWMSLQSKGLSRVFSNTTVQKHQFFCTCAMKLQQASYTNAYKFLQIVAWHLFN